MKRLKNRQAFSALNGCLSLWNASRWWVWRRPTVGSRGRKKRFLYFYLYCVIELNPFYYSICTFNQLHFLAGTWTWVPMFFGSLFANTAWELYGDIDRLELYPGLHAEVHQVIRCYCFGMPFTFTVCQYVNMSDWLVIRPWWSSSYHWFHWWVFRVIICLLLSLNLPFFVTIEDATAWGCSDVAREPDNKAFGGHSEATLPFPSEPGMNPALACLSAAFRKRPYLRAW